MTVLGDITPEEFLKTYWQKQPCLIRQAIPGYTCPLSPEELAGLACEPDSQARLVIEAGHGTNSWEVEYGPFTAGRFSQLPSTHWSLLVHQVDHFVPAVHALFSRFDFIPQWRIDDVMISYAADQGSVGPHLDSYDVFLLQGMGQRHWKINRHDYSEKDFIPGLDLRIIDDFKPEQEWTLEPGDMLYLPPGVAHHGVARGPCMTLSIGFLAPLGSDLVHHFIDDEISSTASDIRFSDPDRIPQEHTGQITGDDLSRIRRMMRTMLADDAAINNWFGRYITGPAIEPELPRAIASNETFLVRFAEKGCLQRYGGIRAGYICENDTVTLFIHGLAFTLDIARLGLIQWITGETALHYDDIGDKYREQEAVELLLELYNHGLYYFDEKE